MTDLNDSQRSFKRLQLPPYTAQMWTAGATYAVQAALCAGVLMFGYQWAGAKGAIWAVVSAVVVLQPGLQQSFEASVFRIAANLIGALVGFALGWLLGTNLWHVMLAMIVVSTLCLAFRMEQSLRTACVSVIIVMTTSDGNIATTGVSRCIGVALGSTLAVSVQVIFESILRRFRGSRKPVQPPAANTQVE